jgi:hypothetical protein
MTSVLVCIACFAFYRLGIMWERGSAAKRAALKAKADYDGRRR